MQKLRHFRNMRAQALIEFALVLPVLVLMLAGIVDLGNGFQTYIALSNGAREGASYAAYPIDGTTGGPILTNAQARCRSALPSNLQAGQPCTAIYPGTTGGGCPANTRVVGCPVRVTASYSVNTLVGSVLGFDSFSVSPSVNMMVLVLP